MCKSPACMMLACLAAVLFAGARPAAGEPGGTPVPASAEATPPLPIPPQEGADEEALTALLEISPAERALEIAHALLGTPYAPGGSRPGGFDCSGLVQYVYRQIGIELPRSSREQYNVVKRIPSEELQPGDLLFFSISKGRISHVGIYVREDLFIHAPSRGRKVSYDSLGDAYWRARFVGAGRLFEPESS